MNSIEIYEKIKKIFPIYKYFLGVFPYDKIPRIESNLKYIIVNTQSSKFIGDHWIAIIIDRKECHYFDSFGRKPYRKPIEKLFKNCNKFYYNKRQLQSFFSSYCGFYCIIFLFYYSKFKNTKEFYKLFTYDFDKNDLIVKKLFMKYFE